MLEGMSIVGLQPTVVSYQLQLNDIDILPCIAHGTQTASLLSIMNGGLLTMGRLAVMMSGFPHWDPRIGEGQRSRDWTAIIFLSKERMIVGDVSSGGGVTLSSYVLPETLPP